MRMVADLAIGARHGLGYARFAGYFAGLAERGACHAPLYPDRL
jgi:hypothetical protein